jgi:DNA invertase Pin-like site-specific DNA recombinase
MRNPTILIRESPLDQMRAAAYVRMSTDHQQYSIPNQLKAISEYAALHGMEVVKIYADEHKSGLTFDRRPSLKRLLSDIEMNPSLFGYLLVYDVSRWGRFQDADESAYYEFRCRRQGVSVVYCAEPFVNDGSPLSVILKNLKRSMAAEFSRELSVKIFATHTLIASRGHYPGSRCLYGLRRVAFDENGRRRKILWPGRQKDVETDHVVLAPGSPKEIATVREIFEFFANHGWATRRIASHLNARGCAGPTGRKWSSPAILRMLHNEKYIGTQFYNRTSSRLCNPSKINDPSLWTIKRNAFEGIVDVALFNRAQGRLGRGNTRWSDDELLDGLRRYISRHGRITHAIVRGSREFANSNTYRDRFGSLRKACELAGFPDLPTVAKFDKAMHRRQIRLGVMEKLWEVVETHGGTLMFGSTGREFKLNGHLGYCGLSYASGDKNVAPFWRVKFPNRHKIELYIIGRLLDRDVPIDYDALPCSEAPSVTGTLFLDNPRLDNFRYADLEQLGSALADPAWPVTHVRPKPGRSSLKFVGATT